MNAPAASGLGFQTVTPPAGLFPTATHSAPTGIVGSFITAIVWLANGTTAGALDDVETGTWTPLRFPAAASTAAYGPAITAAGYRVVGSYQNAGSADINHGFFYDSASGAYATIDPPAVFCAPHPCNQAIAHSNYGATAFKVVGNCDSTDRAPVIGDYPTTGHAFLYDSASASFTLIDIPGALSSTAYGIWIDGSDVAVAGGFSDGAGTHAYVRDLTAATIVRFDYPSSEITHFEGITGAGGPGNYNVIGDAVSAQNGTELGFFLPIRNWTAGAPLALGTNLSANSVFERTVVGVTSTATSGYLVNVPGT